MNANAAEAAPVSAPSSRAGTLETLLWLARRELWEHRSLWIAPPVVAGVLALCLLLGQVNLDVPLDPLLSHSARVAIFTYIVCLPAQLLFLVAVISLGFYLLDALYAERKDRSILFWKSLPVSDELTVGSKFFVAAVVVPLGVWALAMVSDLLFAGILALRLPGAMSFSAYEWLRAELVLLVEVLLAVLWYAPIAGLLLLCSAWVRKSPVMWVSLVSVVAPLIERIGLGTGYIWKFEQYRINGIWHKLSAEGAAHLFNFAHPSDLHPAGDLLNVLDLRTPLTDMDLWLGVIAAVALAYAAARVRRFRDDT